MLQIKERIGDLPGPWGVQVGGHQDKVDYKDYYKRWPIIYK